MARRKPDYTLYHGRIRIGVVRDAGDDFPGVFGQLEIAPTLERARCQSSGARLRRYLELTRESYRLSFGLSRRAKDKAKAEIDTVERELGPLYGDFAESERWLLFDRAGVKHPILCPIFCDDGEIRWRWRRGP